MGRAAQANGMTKMAMSIGNLCSGNTCNGVMTPSRGASNCAMTTGTSTASRNSGHGAKALRRHSGASKRPDPYIACATDVRIPSLLCRLRIAEFSQRQLQAIYTRTVNGWLGIRSAAVASLNTHTSPKPRGRKSLRRFEETAGSLTSSMSVINREIHVREHFVAVFETEAAANAAAQDLEAAGFPASAIRRYGAGRSSDASQERTGTESSSGGFWAWLLGEEGPQTTQAAYGQEGEWYDRRVGEGHACLSVVVDDDSRIHRATEILELHRPVEIEETTEEPLPVEGTGEIRDASGSIRDGVPPDARPRASAERTEEIIPLAEEELEVGKRTVDRGTTRVRRYVVEAPAEREITLRGERVIVERRRPVAGQAPDHAFEERIVEVHETDEVPVVTKTARVTEEVTVRKEQTERHERVRDTVRREEVEITDKDGSRASAAE